MRMEKLGIQPIQLLTQTINFLIMVFVLQKLLYKPIMTALENRRKKIEEGLKLTQMLKVEMEKVEKKKGEILEKARKDARVVIEDGKKAGEGVRAEIIAKAQEEAKEIVEKGRKDIELERKEMEVQLQGQTVEIAAEMTRRLLSDTLSVADQKTIIEKRLKKIAHVQK